MKRSFTGIIATLVLVLTFGSTAALAATWSVGSVSVPSWGGGSRTSASNLKDSNSNYASFKGSALPNSFGYNVRLVNVNNDSRSNSASLKLNETTRASENSGTINYYYYARVNSKILEPSTSTVKLSCSSDYK